MSGMYNVVMGDGNEVTRGNILLAVLGNPSIGRFRDAWIERDGETPIIAIYTRNGGGNRQHYDDSCDASCTGCVMEKIVEHQYYLRDADDEFDRTYATIYFSTPPEFVDEFAQLAIEPVNMSERWKKLIDSMNGL